MAPIPQTRPQPTVDAIYRAYEARAGTEHRPHLGASVIGRECARALWYAFRWAVSVRHSGRVLRLFERGQNEEAVFVANLRAAGVEVLDRDSRTGEQFRFSDVGGHMGGSMDAQALGILEAPKTWHVCEFKTHGAKSFATLKANGLAKAKPEHAAQMQCYMHWSELTRAFYLAVCKDTDELYSERLRYDTAAATALIERARRIIQASEPPARISERPDWYLCKWCDAYDLCHQGAMPEVSCRTCVHAIPEDTHQRKGTGRWSCARFGCDLPVDVQRQGAQCHEHVFIPALVPWLAVDANADENWVEYRTPDGRTVRNGPGGYASRELAAAPGLCGDAITDMIREQFGAEMVAE
ncbi:MAG: hypothetical protein RL456_2746 [Pseudomonadota bacterium]|jgi:hypothetical protein